MYDWEPGCSMGQLVIFQNTVRPLCADGRVVGRVEGHLSSNTRSPSLPYCDRQHSTGDPISWTREGFGVKQYAQCSSQAVECVPTQQRTTSPISSACGFLICFQVLAFCIQPKLSKGKQIPMKTKENPREVPRACGLETTVCNYLISVLNLQ